MHKNPQYRPRRIFNTFKYEFSQKKKKKKKERHSYVHNLSNPVKKLSAFKFLFSDNFLL